MNYYQFHISDWALHTSHLTLEEEGVYRRMLDYFYDTERPIPEKTQPVIRRLRLGSHSDIFGLILDEFFTLEGDGWHNVRADREIQQYKEKAERARDNGKKGGRPKKQLTEKQLVSELENPEKTQSVILANPEITRSKANQEPITKNQEEEKINKKKSSRRFVKPTVDEVREYTDSRKQKIDPQRFVDHYESNGWKVGKNPMKDWKATVRTWEARQKEDNAKQSGTVSQFPTRKKENLSDYL